MTTIIQINDNNLLIRQNDTLDVSQGYAWFKDGQVYFDNDFHNSAVRHSHLFPQQINNHYWQQCDQTPVAKNDSGVRHAADLIWKHLSALKEQYNLADVIFSVPSHYQDANLQLLLGIAKACNLKVIGLLNNAVLALHDKVTDDGEYLYIDMQLHQAVCSTVSVQKGQLSLVDVEVIHEVSLLAMQDVMLKTIQHNFIQNDRFDPLHYAQTEQQLFDQLPDMVNKLTLVGKASVSIDYQSQQHTANIEAKQLIAVLKPLYAILSKVRAQRAYQQVFYMPNGVEPIALEQSMKNGVGILDGYAKCNVNELVDLILTQSDSDDDVAYVTQCPASDSNKKNKKVRAKKTKRVVNGSGKNMTNAGVTHLLQSGIAVSLDKAFIEISNNDLLLINKNSNINELLEQGSIFIINDDKRKTLQPNDRLASNLADGVISAIQVENDG